jgi:alkanesulfonate monooxygenase SsuD/methylene tetrahydromethanopterin reductase-like flavin-dependent oxidoreductase (luciferase family)
VAQASESEESVQFFGFHLMPWPYLPDEFAASGASTWVTLSNENYDPVRGHELYARYLDELVEYERVGFDGICVNEHHQTAYGLMPAPNLIAAALARSTKQAKIAILGRALPLVSNPVAVAEEFAMLDHLSGGRVITGFVRGIGTEYFASGVNPTHSHGRYYEAHELILRAWTEVGPFRYHGRHYQFDYVNLWPRPLQQPHPPVWTHRKAAPRQSNGAPRPSANTPTCKPSAR